VTHLSTSPGRRPGRRRRRPPPPASPSGPTEWSGRPGRRRRDCLASPGPGVGHPGDDLPGRSDSRHQVHVQARLPAAWIVGEPEGRRNAHEDVDLTQRCARRFQEAVERLGIAHVAHGRMDLDAARPQLGLGFPQRRLPSGADGRRLRLPRQDGQRWLDRCLCSPPSGSRISHADRVPCCRDVSSGSRGESTFLDQRGRWICPSRFVPGVLMPIAWAARASPRLPAGLAQP
jgi:hypothetical protein